MSHYSTKNFPSYFVGLHCEALRPSDSLGAWFSMVRNLSYAKLILAIAKLPGFSKLLREKILFKRKNGNESRGSNFVSPFQIPCEAFDSLFSGSLRNSIIFSKESFLYIFVQKRSLLFRIGLGLDLGKIKHCVK